MAKKSGEGSPGGMGDMMGMLQKAQEQAEKMKQKMEEDLKEKTVEGTTGGGMVKVTMAGNLEVRNVELDPSLLDPKEKDMVEDLLAAAVNVAAKKAKELQEEAQQGQLGDMLGGGGGMPDLGQLFGGGGGGM